LALNDLRDCEHCYEQNERKVGIGERQLPSLFAGQAALFFRDEMFADVIAGAEQDEDKPEPDDPALQCCGDDVSEGSAEDDEYPKAD
jgi:hypothetical protein